MSQNDDSFLNISDNCFFNFKRVLKVFCYFLQTTWNEMQSVKWNQILLRLLARTFFTVMFYSNVKKSCQLQRKALQTRTDLPVTSIESQTISING